ncbi:PREDICTED: serine/threonine-protein phosphatase 2A regulatory subunit B'' subunit beta-like, partial [Myotis brandtii]|uniref:serine/threonine-protein phosphatase 2A regulatory subunit B'' subunit beta-like n=1 Tax=Myotis brandtii TaxID=109478 RepID=UPI000703C55F
ARGCDFVLPSRFKKRLKAFQQVQTKKEEARPPAASQSIPTFYFPRGRPQGTADSDAIIARIESTFAQFPHERATVEDMGKVAKVGPTAGAACSWLCILTAGRGLSPARVRPSGQHAGPAVTLCARRLGVGLSFQPRVCGSGSPCGRADTAGSLASARRPWRTHGPSCWAGGEDGQARGRPAVRTGRPLPRILQNCHDEATRFVHLLMSPGCNYLVQEDFVPFLQLPESFWGPLPPPPWEAVPGTPAHARVCLQNVALLEEEADINQLTEFFSYEHFYVIYCKFWELDTDHDLLIGQQDLARHNDHAISTKMIERIFSGAVTRYVSRRRVPPRSGLSLGSRARLTPALGSIEYWFRCMDLDGDGALSMFELEHFYEEQSRRLDCMGIEALPFEDCLCQMLDL